MDMMVKVCPVCKHINPVNEIYCEKCDSDLSLVPASAPPQAAAEAPAAPGNPPAPPRIVPTPIRPQPAMAGQAPAPVMQTGRQCRSCSRLSPLSTMVCPQCGASLSSAPIVRAEAAHPPQTEPVQSGYSWMLVSCDNQAHLTITEGQHLLIGWAGELGDYLERTRKDYVSNRHGMLSVVHGELFFEDSSSNGTLINDRPIPKGQAQKLSAGDILCMGGRPGMQMAQAAYFRVDRR